MKRPDNTLIKFKFVVKTYYRSVQLGADDTHEVTGIKTIKLFRSWFRLMKNKKRLLYGVARFADGETFIWQNPNFVFRGGWQRTRPPRTTTTTTTTNTPTTNGNEQPYQITLF